ncbi:16633_t:CDS:1, partial [Gigaspora rosea]
MAISKIEAKDKPCIFIFLASKYPKNKLLICEIGEQRWRNASSKAAVKKIQILAQYFPELNLLLDFLKHYSLCQTHYNNLVARNTLINKLEADNQISLDPEENNKSHNFHDFEIQVSLLDPEYNKLLKKINELKNINRQLLFENELLKNKLKERFNSQQDHMKAIIEIAKKERNNLYDDLTNLMEDYNQFYLD